MTPNSSGYKPKPIHDMRDYHPKEKGPVHSLTIIYVILLEMIRLLLGRILGSKIAIYIPCLHQKQFYLVGARMEYLSLYHS